MKPCSDCNGTGVEGDRRGETIYCKTCEGAGRVGAMSPHDVTDEQAAHAALTAFSKANGFTSPLNGMRAAIAAVDALRAKRGGK